MRLAFHNLNVYGPGNGLPMPFSPSNLGYMTKIPGIGAITPQQTVSTTIQASQAGASTALMLGGSTNADIVGGIEAGVLAAAPFTGPAAPFVAAVGALIGPIASFFKGCGSTCTASSDMANQVEYAAQSIMAQYWNSPIRTVTMQAAAVSGLQQLYQYLIQNCQKIGGQGGAQCIADRQPGGKYDFQGQQIVPIQNDPSVVPDPVDPNSITGKLSGLLSGGGGGLPIPLLVGGGLLALFLLAGNN